MKCENCGKEFNEKDMICLYCDYDHKHKENNNYDAKDDKFIFGFFIGFC